MGKIGIKCGKKTNSKVKKINQKRMVAMGMVATSVCSASVGMYTNVMAQDVVLSENAEEVQLLTTSTEPVDALLPQESVSEAAEPNNEIENSTLPEAVSPTEEVVPEVVSEVIVEKEVEESKENVNSETQMLSAADDLTDIKNTNMEILEGIESNILYPSNDITSRINILKNKINNMTDISEVDEIQQEISNIFDLAEVTIYTCNITYDEKYPYEYVNEEDLNNINWLPYQGNFTVDVMNILGDALPSVILVNKVEYSAKTNKIVFTITPSGREFTNANDFITTVSIPVKQVGNIEDNTELIIAQNEAITILKGVVIELTKDCDQSLKNKVLELQDGYISRIKSATTKEEIDSIGNEAANYIAMFIVNGGVDQSELNQKKEEAYAELEVLAEKRDTLNETNASLLIEKIQLSNIAIQSATTIEEINTIVDEANEYYTALKKEEDRIKKELQDAKNAFIEQLNEIDVTKYDEADRETLSANIKNAKTSATFSPTTEILNSVKDTFYNYFSNLQTTEDKANAKLAAAKMKAIKELDTLDYYFLNAANQTKVTDKIALMKITIQSASAIDEINTSVESVKTYIQTLKLEEETAAELENKRAEAIAEINDFDLSLYDRDEQTYINETFKTPAINKISAATKIGEITHALTEFYEGVANVQTIAQKVSAEKKAVMAYIDGITLSDLLESNQRKATAYFNEIKVKINSAKTVMEIKKLKGQIITFVADLRTEDDKQRAEAEALAQAKEATIIQIRETSSAHLLDKNQTVFSALITDIIGKIQDADSVEKVDELLGQFQIKSGEINQKDIADRALLAVKETAVNEINAIDLTVYDDADKTNLETQRTEIIRQINAADAEADVEQLAQSFKDNLQNFEMSAEKEAKKLGKAKADAKKTISEYEISMLADQFKTLAETIKGNAVAAIDNAATVDAVLQVFNQTMTRLDEIKADDMAAKTLAEAKVSASNQIGTVQNTDYDEEDRETVASLKDAYLVKVEEADTVNKVTAALSEFKGKLEKIYTTAKKAEMALDNRKAEAINVLQTMDLSIFSSKNQYIMISYLQNTKTDVSLADSIAQIDEILTRAEAYYADMKVADFKEQVTASETKFAETYKNAIASVDINKIDMSTIKEALKGDLKAYFAVVNYRIEQILERVKAELQKLVDEQGISIRLMSVGGEYQFVSGTRSGESILGIDISGLSDAGKAKAMAIFNQAIAEINQILADTDEYIQSVTKAPAGSVGEESKPSNSDSQSQKSGSGTGESVADENELVKISGPQAVKTGDEANAVLPAAGLIGALAGLGYLFRKRKQ